MAKPNTAETVENAPPQGDLDSTQALLEMAAAPKAPFSIRDFKINPNGNNQLGNFTLSITAEGIDLDLYRVGLFKRVDQATGSYVHFVAPQSFQNGPVSNPGRPIKSGTFRPGSRMATQVTTAALKIWSAEATRLVESYQKDLAPADSAPSSEQTAI